MVSPAAAPDALRAEARLAAVLRDADLNVEIIEGPTPQIDEVAATMRKDLFLAPAAANEEPSLYDDDRPSARDPRIGDALSMFDDLVVTRFLQTGRAPSWDSEVSVRAVMDCAARVVGVPLVLLDEEEVRWLLFEVVPREYNLEPSRAQSFVKDLRAFFRYVKGEFGEEYSAAGTAALSGKAVSKLKAELKRRAQPVSATGPSRGRAASRVAKSSEVVLPSGLERLDPIPVQDMGPFDPREFFGSELHPSFEPWASQIIERGPRPFLEMESLVPGRDVGDFDGDPIYSAIRLRETGHPARALVQLRSLIEEEPRCLDAYAHFGSFVFDADVDAALAYYEEGVRQGDASLQPFGPSFVPWLGLGNRPYLRCLHGMALCLWRLRRWKKAESAFERLLWLNPSDNQGARFGLPAVAARTAWSSLA